MKLIGPVGIPGVRYRVKLVTGIEVVATMTMHRDGFPDGSWVTLEGKDVTAFVEELNGLYRDVSKHLMT